MASTDSRLESIVLPTGSNVDRVKGILSSHWGKLSSISLLVCLTACFYLPNWDLFFVFFFFFVPLLFFISSPLAFFSFSFIALRYYLYLLFYWSSTKEFEELGSKTWNKKLDTRSKSKKANSKVHVYTCDPQYTRSYKCFWFAQS